MWHVWGRGVDYRALVGNLREGDHVKDPGVDGRIILRSIFKRLDSGGGAKTGSIWLRIGTGSRLVELQ
jgi:hypothetical protein